MTDAQLILQQEVYQGNKAQVALDSYMNAYFEKFRKNVTERIYNCEFNELIDIKNEILAIKALEASIYQDIETGKLANNQLRTER